MTVANSPIKRILGLRSWFLEACDGRAAEHLRYAICDDAGGVGESNSTKAEECKGHADSAASRNMGRIEGSIQAAFTMRNNGSIIMQRHTGWGRKGRRRMRKKPAAQCVKAVKHKFWYQSAAVKRVNYILQNRHLRGGGEILKPKYGYDSTGLIAQELTHSSSGWKLITGCVFQRWALPSPPRHSDWRRLRRGGPLSAFPPLKF
jgi:hypothetical protein